MKTILTCVCILIQVSCVTAVKNTVTVTGKAGNAKAGAVVISNNDSVLYYVGGLDVWNDSITGREVTIPGTLLVEDTKPQPSGEPVKQQITGIKRTIQNAKWQLTQ